MSYVSFLRDGACDNGRVTVTVGVPSGKRIEIASGSILLSDSARQGFLIGSLTITDTAVIDGVEVKVLGIANNIVRGELSQACVR